MEFNSGFKGLSTVSAPPGFLKEGEKGSYIRNIEMKRKNFGNSVLSCVLRAKTLHYLGTKINPIIYKGSVHTAQ